MTEVTLSSRNRIVIPREAREALGLKPGDKVLVVPRGSSAIILQKPESYHQAIRGLARESYPKDYLQKERRSCDWRASLFVFHPVLLDEATSISKGPHRRPRPLLQRPLASAAAERSLTLAPLSS